MWRRFGCLLLAVVVWIADAHAQETCGLVNVQPNRAFYDGFENQSGAASIASWTDHPASKSTRTTAPSLGRPVSVITVPKGGPAPTLTVTSPAEASVLSNRSFVVRGTFTAPINSGVTVNDQPVLVFGNEFSSLPMDLPQGPNAIIVRVHTMSGAQASVTRNVTIAATPAAMTLATQVPAGLSPAEIDFRLSLGSAPLDGQVSVDFDGNGSADWTGLPQDLPSRRSFASPGLYIARATASVGSLPVNAETAVLIADVIANRERGCAIYGALRTALSDNQLEASLLTFVGHQREALRPFFTALGNNRPVFAGRLGTIGTGMISIDRASYTIVRIEGADAVAYPLEVAQDIDGIWRITSF